MGPTLSAIGLPSLRSGAKALSALLGGPRVARIEDEHAWLAALRGGDDRVDVHVVRSGLADFRVGREQFASAIDREDHRAADHLPLHRVQVELERSHDAEIAAAAAHCPVQVLVLLGARVTELAVRVHDVDRLDVVEREAEAPRQPAEARAECQSADAGVRYRAGGRDEAERHRLVIQFAEQAATIDPGLACGRIDAHAAHGRKVDLHAAFTGRLACVAVPAALDRQQQVLLAGKVHGRADVGGAARLNDQRRMLVDRLVAYVPRNVVAGIAGQQQRAAQAVLQLLQVGGRECRGTAAAADSGDIPRDLRGPGPAVWQGRGNRCRHGTANESTPVHVLIPPMNVVVVCARQKHTAIPRPMGSMLRSLRTRLASASGLFTAVGFFSTVRRS